MFHPFRWFLHSQYHNTWREQIMKPLLFNVHHECKLEPHTWTLIMHRSGCQVTTCIWRNPEGSWPCSKQPTTGPDCVPCWSEFLVSCLILNFSIRWRCRWSHASTTLLRQKRTPNKMVNLFPFAQWRQIGGTELYVAPLILTSAADGTILWHFNY